MYQKKHPDPQKMKFWMKNKNRCTYSEFGIRVPQPPTYPNFKTNKNFVLQKVIELNIYNYT